MSALHFQEFLKVPILIDHYKVHLAQNPEMSVLDFFNEHYLNCDLFVSDYDQNMKLPFKSDSKTCENLVQFWPQPSQLGFLISFINKTPVHKTPSYTDSLYSQFLNKIWQPPKLA